MSVRKCPEISLHIPAYCFGSITLAPVCGKQGIANCRKTATTDGSDEWPLRAVAALFKADNETERCCWSEASLKPGVSLGKGGIGGLGPMAFGKRLGLGLGLDWRGCRLSQDLMKWKRELRTYVS